MPIFHVFVKQNKALLPVYKSTIMLLRNNSHITGIIESYIPETTQLTEVS